MASTISSLSAFCSRSFSLQKDNVVSQFPDSQKEGRNGLDVHRLVDLLHREFAVYLLHGLAGLLHRLQRLAVDIRRLDGVYLLLERADLTQGLLQGVLVRLLAFQNRLRSYVSASPVSVTRSGTGLWIRQTVLVCGDVLPGDSILLVYLVRQMRLSFLQHVELCPQVEDGTLGGVVGPLGSPPSEPAPDARHVFVA